VRKVVGRIPERHQQTQFSFAIDEMDETAGTYSSGAQEGRIEEGPWRGTTSRF
jgi:hypothetical protein